MIFKNKKKKHFFLWSPDQVYLIRLPWNEIYKFYRSNQRATFMLYIHVTKIIFLHSTDEMSETKKKKKNSIERSKITFCAFVFVSFFCLRCRSKDLFDHEYKLVTTVFVNCFKYQRHDEERDNVWEVWIIQPNFIS